MATTTAKLTHKKRPEQMDFKLRPASPNSVGGADTSEESPTPNFLGGRFDRLARFFDRAALIGELPAAERFQQSSLF